MELNTELLLILIPHTAQMKDRFVSVLIVVVLLITVPFALTQLFNPGELPWLQDDGCSDLYSESNLLGDILIDSEGNSYVIIDNYDESLKADNVIGNITEKFHLFMLKLDPSGELIYSLAIDAESWRTVLDNDDNLVIIGQTHNPEFPSVEWKHDQFHSIVMKIDKQGKLLWSEIFTETWVYDVTIDSFNNIFV